MCITERQTVMDKELDYGQTEERDRKKSQSWQDRNLYFSDVLGARGVVSVLLDAFNLRKKLRFL